MHFTNVLLGVTAAVLPTTLAGLPPIKGLTPPDYFILTVESNNLTTNGLYDGYNVQEQRVSPTKDVALLAPAGHVSPFFQLLQPNTTADGTFYSLTIDAGANYVGFALPDSESQAFFEAVNFYYTNNTVSPQSTVQEQVFYIDGTPDKMYLQMDPRLHRSDDGFNSIGFQGWLACYWSQLTPQLFFWTYFSNPKYNKLPSVCQNINLRIVPIVQTP